VTRLERLINLTAALLEAEQPLPAEELRRRVPGYADDKATFRRAFERDKETLRDMGVPVVVERVPGTDPAVDGYRIPKEAYYLRDPGLADDELAALHLAASAVRVEGASGMGALWKLGGEVAGPGPAGPAGPASVASVASVAAVAAVPGADHLAPVFAAIGGRRRLAFAYRGRDRTVDPHRLAFRAGHWYLFGTDVEAGEGRSFRLDRISGPVAAGAEGSAEPPTAAVPAGPPAPWETGAGEAVTARLLVDAEQAGWAVGHVGQEALAERRPDGSVVLDVRVTNRDAFRSFVLGFLDHAELLGPPELRDDLVRWLEGLCPA
jgi:predicted DNA-binding transcriptional regulator YafY